MLPEGAKAEKIRMRIEKLREAKAWAWKRVLVALMMTFITQGGEGRGNTNKKRKATKSKGRGLEEGASLKRGLLALMSCPFQRHLRLVLAKATCKIRSQRPPKLKTHASDLTYNTSIDRA